MRRIVGFKMLDAPLPDDPLPYVQLPDAPLPYVKLPNAKIPDAPLSYGQQQIGPRLMVKLTLGDDVFYGYGYSQKHAKHDAARKALLAIEGGKCRVELPSGKNGITNNNNVTPTYAINELALSNRIGKHFNLVAAKGPDHKRIFLVSLELGSEKYSGEGTTIKKAQHDAAAKALRETAYVFPEKKPRCNIKDLYPTAALNSIAQQYHIRPVYEMATYVRPDATLLDTALSDTAPSDTALPDNQQQVIRRPLTGDDDAYDKTKTRQALRVVEKSFSKYNEKIDTSMTPVSHLYLLVTQLNLPINFTLLGVEGKQHLPVYTTKCEFESYFAFGYGKKKKESKQDAALKLLQSLPLNVLPHPFRPSEAKSNSVSNM